VFSFDEAQDTRLKVQLPGPIEPGESVEVSLDWQLDIPELQGRVGKFQGVTTLLNWYPVLAVYGKDGWDAPPFVAWHLSFLTEAASYHVHLELPQGEEVASSGQVVARAALPDGFQRLEIVGEGLRDFSMVASTRFVALERIVDGVKVRVLAFPEHRFYAQQSLETASECLPLFSNWFCKYPYPEFTIVESFFGWNGNQSSGLVLIDERIFRAPELGQRYIDALVSHETCHQWWYVIVGNDGYRESWISESTVVHLTKLRMNAKYGPNCDLLTWPEWFTWMPNIQYEANAHGGYYLYRGRGGSGHTVAPLPDMIHLHNLFFLVYDRGAKVVEMIHHRLGDERYFAFMRRVTRRYAYRNCSVADFRHELEEYTSKDWKRYFDDWLRSPKITDWKIGRVDVRVAPEVGYCTTVRVKQLAEICEPTELGVKVCKGGAFVKQVPFDPELGDHAFSGGNVRRVGACEWEVTFTSDQRPVEIEVDPYHQLLDANMGNNKWHGDIPTRFTPFYTPIDEAPLLRPLDYPSFVFGPGVDIDGRLVLRGSLVQGYRYRISPFFAYEQRRGSLTMGVDSEFFNTPIPNVSTGLRYEHFLTTGLYNAPTDEAKAFVRWYQAYTSSFIYPHLAYVEGYFRFGDNFGPVYETIREPTNPLVKDFRNVRAFGLTYHGDTRFPYWNPEKGYAIDANTEFGARIGGKGDPYQRVSAQYAAVHRLPDEWGPLLSDFRVAGRVAGGYGAPDNGYQFRFGGPLGFRGQRSEDEPNSAFWLSSAELRFPLLTKLDLQGPDNVVTWESLYGSVFYDVGDAWLLGVPYGVDHTIGAGLYFQLGVLSFVERLGLRLEFGHSVNHNTNVLWFGMFHSF
jgi:hypothetical protein